MEVAPETSSSLSEEAFRTFCRIVAGVLAGRFGRVIVVELAHGSFLGILSSSRGKLGRQRGVCQELKFSRPILA